MKIKLFVLCLVAILTITLLGPSAQSQLAVDVVKNVQSMSMFKATKFSEHLRMVRDEDITRILENERILLPGMSALQKQSAVQEFKKQFIERNPTTPNRTKYKALLANERNGTLAQLSAADAPDTSIKSLVVPVEFNPADDTFLDDCGTEVTFSGPLHNEIAPPGPRDNNTVYFSNTTPELYNKLYFGVGPTAGVIIHHPNLGNVDLRAYTMANYYLEQSEGRFQPTGEIYPKWLQASRSEAWYGTDGCVGGSHNVRAGDLVHEVIDGINADDSSFAWQNFDGDGDGVVDNFTVIHAGQGQEAGGGAQGDYSIWSHASSIDWPTGHLVCTAGSAGCPDRDIYVSSYSMDPENIDIGVIAEEFGHAAFGLPDLYTTDADASIADWAIMEAGSWNGKLAGMQPAPFPLWFRYLLGWADPVVYNYDSAAAQVKVGQLSLRPRNTESGIRINLPDKEKVVPNPLNTGNALWSTVADETENTVSRDFDLTAATAPITFSFNSYWSIEEDWDYGYVEVSTDGGTTWDSSLQEMNGYTTTYDPNSQNQGWGLTGENSDRLSYDLSAYAGQNVTVRLRYWTDAAAQWDGWWADDVSLTDNTGTLFSDDFEAGAGNWNTDSWTLTPYSQFYKRYYLAEWRNMSGFDQGLKYPYQTVYNDENNWQVDRAPYTVPGMVLYFRDASYDLDYTLLDSIWDSPSYGPKHGLIVVDSHFDPYTWNDTTYSSTGQKVRLNDRLQAGNAAFTLQKTQGFKLRLGYDPNTGAWVNPPQEIKTFAPQPAVSQFHDSLGYYPGMWYRSSARQLKFWDAAASAVVPAWDNYTTKLTYDDNTPYYARYGWNPYGDSVMGSGNPGDEGVQYGLHLAVVDKAANGSWGVIKLWNSESLFDMQSVVSVDEAKAGDYLTFKLKVINNTPLAQSFQVSNRMPNDSKFVSGQFYVNKTNSIEWKGTVKPYGSTTLTFRVMILKGTTPGTFIENEAWLTDGALGAYTYSYATVK